MKKLSYFVLFVFVAFVSFSCANEPNQPPAASVWDGTSAEIEWYSENKNQFELNSASQLAGLAKLVNAGKDFNGKTVVLNVDVYLASRPWTPIGTGERNGKTIKEGSNVFSGTFDGKNHTISGLAIDGNYEKNHCVGFFGILKNGKISNLNFKDAKVSVPESSVAGIAVGYAIEGSTIERVKTDANSSISAKEAGGIIGRMPVSGTISNCVNNAHVLTSAGGTGGIVGKAYYSEDSKTIIIDNCKNFGDIKASNGGYVGGISGLFAGDMTDCENTGKISGTNTSIGGLVGELTNYGFIKNCINKGDVSCTAEAGNIYGLGGIVGWIRYSQNVADYGRSEIINISDNKNYASVQGDNSYGVGGIVGMLFNAGTIENNESSAAVIKGDTFVSGIVGGLQVDNKNAFSSPENLLKTTFKNNRSTISDDAIVGNSCKSTIVYINPVFPVENVTGNSPENKTLK